MTTPTDIKYVVSTDEARLAEHVANDHSPVMEHLRESVQAMRSRL